MNDYHRDRRCLSELEELRIAGVSPTDMHSVSELEKVDMEMLVLIKLEYSEPTFLQDALHMNKSIAHLERDELVFNNDLNDLSTIDRQMDSKGYDQPLSMSTNEEKSAAVIAQLS